MLATSSAKQCTGARHVIRHMVYQFAPCHVPLRHHPPHSVTGAQVRIFTPYTPPIHPLYNPYTPPTHPLYTPYKTLGNGSTREVLAAEQSAAARVSGAAARGADSALLTGNTKFAPNADNAVLAALAQTNVRDDTIAQNRLAAAEPTSGSLNSRGANPDARGSTPDVRGGNPAARASRSGRPMSVDEQARGLLY